MSAVNAFLEQLQQRNIVLWEQSGKLRFRAPEGVFSPELRQQVSEQKAEILAALREQNALQHNPLQREAPFPLTDVQAAYLLGRTRVWEGGGTGCHGYAELDIMTPERWQPDDYHTAWQQMVACHPMLQARFSRDGWQQIDPGVAVPLEVSVCHSEQAYQETSGAIEARLKTRHYDPQDPPLIEAHIVTSGTQATLHLSVDLIITDFVGIGVILNDFFQALACPDQLPTAPSLSFRDYVLHLARMRKTPAGEEARQRAIAFWQEKVLTLPEAAGLGATLPDATEEVSYHRRSFLLNKQAWQAFLRQARQHGITPTAVALAVLGGIARRYGDRPRSRVTLTVLDRQPLVEDIMRIVGDFTSTVLVAVDTQREKVGNTIVDVAAEVQLQLFDALDHADVSGVEVLRMLPYSENRLGSVTPVVMTSTLGAGEASNPFYRNNIEKGLSQTPQVLLDIQLSDAEGGMAIVWDSRVGGYPEPVLDAAFADFCTAITALAASPERWTQTPLAHTPLQVVLPPQEEDEVEPSLIAAFCRLAEQAPDRAALIDGDTLYSRGDLLQRACDWHEQLVAQGCQPGDAALVVLLPGFEQVAAQLGALLAGAAFVPLDPEWPQARQQAIQQTLRQCYPQRRQFWLVAEAMPKASKRSFQRENYPLLRGDDIAYIIFTSGSTGTPKGVPITHGQAQTTLRTIQAMINLQEEDRVLAVSRPSFDLAIFNVFGLLQVGGALVIPTAGTTPDPESWARDIIRHQVTIWNSVPAQLQLLLDAQPADCEAGALSRSALRVTLLSGDWIPVSQPAQLAQWLPACHFIALGGATEAAIWSNYHRIQPDNSYSRSIPYGRPLPGQEMRVLNSDGEEAVCGQIGQIVIIGPAVSNGYLGADASSFINLAECGQPAFLTGDLGRYFDNGEIEFLGRSDAQIKRNGHRIEPGEIAAVLKRDPRVGDATVLMTPQHQLLAAVTPVRTDTVEEERHAAESVAQAHQHVLSRLDGQRFAQLVETMELAALVAMQDIRLRNVPAKPEHQPLMARWDRLLAENAARLARWQSRISSETAMQLWQQVRALAEEIDYGDVQLAYVAQCLAQLEDVVRGDVDPLALLFPEGNMEVARASYGENFISRYLNQLIVAGVEAHARKAIAEQRPLRIIEVGAGVGGTTGPVIERLRHMQQAEGLTFTYLFTDVSRYFLDDAARHWPEVTAQLFDLNGDFAAQNIVPASWDIVICANVLHNARHIPQALDRLHSLLAPGGDLAVIDATRPNAPLMVTMEFKEGLIGFTDERAATGDAFYRRESWQRALAASPFRNSVMYPSDTPATDAAERAIQMIHQTVIWASAAGNRARLDSDALNALMRQHLPAWMMPDRLLILDALPLTTNGKVDRQAIVGHLPAPDITSLVPEEAVQPLDEHQRVVANVWTDVLGLESVDLLSPASNFFEAGGDSLLLARCVGGLRKAIPGAEAIPWDTLLRQVVADPTLANCTRVAWQQAGSDADGRGDDKASPVREILPACGEGREDEVLCLVHDGSGGLAPYQALIDALACLGDRPAILGISRTVGDDYLTLPADTLFDALATRYVAALQARNIRRVYLFGYCMGGLIAAVMAEKLTQNGIDVAQLVAVSAYRIPFVIEDDLLLDYSLARLLHRPATDVGLDFPERDLGALINQARAENGQHIPVGCVAALAPRFPQIDAVLAGAPSDGTQRLALLAAASGFDTTTLQALRDVYVASLRAVGAFSRPGYFGDITFLRQCGDIHFLPTLKEDMTEFWRHYCLGELTIHEISGNHFDCLEGEGAIAVAALLEEVWA